MPKHRMLLAAGWLLLALGCRAKVVSIDTIKTQYAPCDGSLHTIAFSGLMQIEGLPSGGLVPAKLVHPRPLFIPDMDLDLTGSAVFPGSGAVGVTTVRFQGGVKWGCKMKPPKCIIFGPSGDDDTDKDTGLVDIDARGNNRSNEFDLVCLK